MTNQNLHALFSPTSVAVVGVSEQTNKIGSVIYDNMNAAGFTGKLFPVNPKYTELRGVKCYPSVSAISEEVDTVCIAVPSAFVMDVLKDAVQKNIKAVVVISSGFAEQGSEGKAREAELVALCKAHNVRVLGPNCLGVISTVDRVNLSFTATMPETGKIAVLSQSGAICTALLDAAAQFNIGFSHIVSVGNQSDISELDLLDYFQQSPSVKVIVAYIEEAKHGLDMFKQYSQYENPKPFIVIKPGKTKAARSAIQSHTGSIASDMSTFHTAAAQYGVITANSLHDLLNYAITFEQQKVPTGNRTVVITNAGGPGILATDTLIEHGFEIPYLSEEIIAELKTKLPETASIHNPLDIGGDAQADRYDHALSVLAKAPNVDQILVILTPQFVTQIDETAKTILSHSLLTNKPIFPVFLGGKYTNAGLEYLYDKHRVGYETLEQAVSAMKALGEFGRWISRKDVVTDPWDFLETQKKPQLLKLNATSNRTLNSEDTETLLKQFNIPLPQQQHCHSIEEAQQFLSKYPLVVLKLSNEVALHKIEKKGVFKNIKSPEGLRDAWDQLYSGQPLMIQEQIVAEQELFLGAQKDHAGMGYLVILGKGGSETEVYKDFGRIVIPANRDMILEQLSRTKVSKILVGFRNQPALAVTEYVKLIEKIQSLLISYPEIESIDFNPVLITQQGVTVVDAKVLV